MDGEQVIPETIRGLLDRRGTFQEWLSRLDELGSEFRPEVAEKVRSDYAGRLADVEAELEGHRSELEAALADRVAAVEEVAAEHDHRSAELEETQLRHAVGEFDDDEWETRRAGHQVEIDRLETDLTEQRSAVESLQTVLAELAGAAAVGGGSTPVREEPPIPEEVVPEEVVPADDEWSEAGGSETEDGAGESAWMTQPFGDEEVEAETDDTVTEEAAEAVPEVTGVEEEPEEAAEVAEDAEAEIQADGGEATVGEESGGEPAEEAESGEFMDELEFLESLSLDDADNFDAVSAMLDEEEGESEAEDESGRKTEDP